MRRIVLVEWYDATGGEITGWRDLEDVQSMRPTFARTVGYLVYEGTIPDTKMNYVVVCPHIVGRKHPQGDGELAIPKSWIKRIITLRTETE